MIAARSSTVMCATWYAFGVPNFLPSRDEGFPKRAHLDTSMRKNAVCHIKSPSGKDLLVPLPWVEKFAEWPLQRSRAAAERVQMRLETHGEWLEVWDAINAGLGSIAELRRQACAWFNSIHNPSGGATAPHPKLVKRRRSVSSSMSHNCTEPILPAIEPQSKPLQRLRKLPKTDQ